MKIKGMPEGWWQKDEEGKGLGTTGHPFLRPHIIKIKIKDHHCKEKSQTFISFK